MRFSRTRLTDVLHRRYSAFPRQSRKGLGGMTVLWRLARPRGSGDSSTWVWAPRPPAVAPVAFLGQPEPQPPECVVPDLAEDTSRVSVAEVPGPPVQEHVEFRDDDLGWQQQPFPAGDLPDPVAGVLGRLA